MTSVKQHLKEWNHFNFDKMYWWRSLNLDKQNIGIVVARLMLFLCLQV